MQSKWRLFSPLISVSIIYEEFNDQGYCYMGYERLILSEGVVDEKKIPWAIVPHGFDLGRLICSAPFFSWDGDGFRRAVAEKESAICLGRLGRARAQAVR